jgi:hypothetical protein
MSTSISVIKVVFFFLQRPPPDIHCEQEHNRRNKKENHYLDRLNLAERYVNKALPASKAQYWSTSASTKPRESALHHEDALLVGAVSNRDGQARFGSEDLRPAFGYSRERNEFAAKTGRVPRNKSRRKGKRSERVHCE